MKNSKRAHRILAWLLTMTLIFTMSFSSIAYAAETGSTGETEGTNTEATTMDTSEEQTSDPAEDTANTQQAAEAEETQNPEALGEEAGTAPAIDGKDVAAIGEQGYDTLAAAAKAAPEGATITLLDNIDIDSQITISKDLTINLNGKSIAAKDARALHIAGGEVNITGEGTISTNKVNDDDFDSAYSVIRVGDNNGDARNAKLTVGENVTVSSNHCYGITVFGNRTIETVVVNGKVNVTGQEAAISGNGTAGYGNTSITVNGEVYAKNVNAIYHPQAGELIVNGTVTGTGGIEAKAGKTEISVGSKAVITATAERTSHNPNNNGCSTSGYAIAAVQNAAYAGNAAITIEGGTINGPVDIVNDNEAEKLASIVIRGGTFTTDPTEFVAEGYIATKQSNEKWTVAETPKVAEIGDKKYASLEDAVADVPDNGTETTIKLIGDVEVEKHVAINSGKNIVLDLNGFDVTSNSYYVFNVGNAKFNITGKGAIIENIEDGYAPIIARGAGENESNYTVITVDKDVTLKGDYSGIFIAKDMAGGYKNYGLVINIKGTIDVSDVGPNNYCGIYINGQNTNTEGNVAAIKLDGAKIIGAKTGIYAAGYGKWNIKNSEIAAENSAMEIRAGEVVIDGGKYSASKVQTATTPNGNGSTTEGAGIAVAQHTTKLPINVTVNGGTIEGFTGLLVTNPQENPGNAGKVKVTVEGGSFKAIKGGTNSIARKDNATDMALVVNGGYFSDSSADNYLAAGKVLLPSDEDGYKYKVGVKNSEIVVSTPAEGENKITGIDDESAKATIQNIDVDLDAAARIKVSKEDVSTDEAKQALTSAGVTVPEDAKVVVQVETFLKIAVEQYPSYNGSKYVLDIKPMYQLVAKTEVNGKEKTAVIGKAAPLEVSNEIEVAIPIPDGFLSGNPGTVTIKHTKDDGKVYYYSARVEKKDGKTFAIFTNPNGFSKFQLMQQSDNVNIDTVELKYKAGSENKSIDTTIEAGKFEYTAKFDAVKNAPEKVMAEVTSTGTDENARVKVLVDGREVKDNTVSIGLGTKTFNVLVLAEDSTAVLYTFNAVRCERVEDVALNKDTFTYSGKAQAPAVTVKTAAGTTLKNGDAYTVSYKGNRTSVGTHTVTVLCKDKYEGEISKDYTINPAKPAIKKIKSSKRKMKVYMTTKPGSKGAKYYKISYRQKGTSTWKSTTTSSSYKTIKGLKKGKRYYVKVYAYTGSYKSVYSTTKLSKKIR